MALTLMGLMINILILAFFLIVLWWAIGLIPMLPEQAKQLLRVIIILIACMYILSMLAGWAPPIRLYDSDPG